MNLYGLNIEKEAGHRWTLAQRYSKVSISFLIQSSNPLLLPHYHGRTEDPFLLEVILGRWLG